MKDKKLGGKIKKTLIIISAFIFCFVVLLISIFKATTETLAVLRPPLTIVVSPVLTPVPTTIKPEVQYYLPYPGILPDHFLYPLKMVRDRIWLWLTTEPLKKTEILLLFADKRLGAGKTLIEGSKIDLGFTTLEKAEKYLEKAAVQLEQAKQKGKQVNILAEKLKTAALKHQEVLEKLAEGLTGETKKAIEKTLIYPVQVLEKVEKILE